MGFKMYGYWARIIKVYRKPSWKNCSGKTNIRIIFFWDTVYQRTFEHIYINKFSGREELLEMIRLEVFIFL